MAPPSVCMEAPLEAVAAFTSEAQPDADMAFASWRSIAVDRLIMRVEQVIDATIKLDPFGQRIAGAQAGEHIALKLAAIGRSEEHTSELQSLMRISYAVFCLKKKNKNTIKNHDKEY